MPRVSDPPEASRSNIGRTLALAVLMAFTIAAPTAAVIAGQNTGAGILAAVGLACMLMLRLEDIAEIGAFGLRAKLRQAIHEAEITTDGLRSLALALAKPILSELAMHGQMMSRINTEELSESHDNIIKSLRDLNASPAELAKANEIWAHVALIKLVQLIRARLVQTNNSSTEMALSSLVQTKGGDLSASDVSNFLDHNDIHDIEIAELSKDINYLKINGSFRRPSAIPFNISIGR